MKKSIFIAVLGLAAGVASSYGQGLVAFSSYSANNGNGATASVLGGGLVPAGYTAGLYYFIGSVSDPVNNGSAASISSLPSASFTLYTGVNATSPFLSGAAQGYFAGGIQSIPGYSSGTITFQVVAYNGADYGSSLIRGRSGSFTMNSVATPGNPAPFLGDNGQAMPNFFVAPVPEPTTLALAGMGGLAALVAFRRKQA